MGVRWSAAVLVLTLLPAVASAANHIVTAQSNFTFSPSDLTIAAGDTVTFKNGGGFHNVKSDPGAVTMFRCANGCDGAGGNGNLGHHAETPGDSGRFWITQGFGLVLRRRS